MQQTHGWAKRLLTSGKPVIAAVDVGAALAKGPTGSFGLTKALLNNAYLPADEFFAAEALTQAVAFGSREFAEGVSAFRDKRAPNFTIV